MGGTVRGGCGAYSGLNDMRSRPCQFQGIFSAEAWYKHLFEPYIGEINLCGFTFTQGTFKEGDAKSAFSQGLRATGLIWENIKVLEANKINVLNNELVIKTWATNIPGKLPIQAFFYITDVGKKYAKADQANFYHKTQQFVPVIRVDALDPSPGKLTFSYQHDDQNVQP